MATAPADGEPAMRGGASMKRRAPDPAAPFSDRTAMVLPSLTNFILALYTIFFPPNVSQRPTFPLRNTLNFRLRHFHAVTPSAHVYFADVPLHSSLHDPQPLSIPIAPVRTARPPSAAAFSEARALSMRGQSTTLDWEEDDIMGPDVSKRETLLLLAKMTSNAYVEPDTDWWYNLTDEWDIVRSHLVFSVAFLHADTRSGRPQHSPVGWEPDDDGFRGYIFATDDNSTVVLSIKGTSAQWVDKGPTTERDKLNDNLLFSCCCARINWSWTTVCDCYRGGWKCNQDCLEDALVEESLFYPVGTVCFIIF